MGPVGGRLFNFDFRSANIWVGGCLEAKSPPPLINETCSVGLDAGGLCLCFRRHNRSHIPRQARRARQASPLEVCSRVRVMVFWRVGDKSRQRKDHSGEEVPPFLGESRRWAPFVWRSSDGRIFWEIGEGLSPSL